MKKILIGLSVIAAVAAIVVGGTIAYFSDTETSAGNTISSGTVDINIDGNNPWEGTYQMENMEPGDSKDIAFNIKNVGTYPARVWKIIKNVQTEENGITEPEQDWYNANNGGSSKNDIDSAIVYEMYVNENLAVEKEAGITLSQIKDYYINLVKTDQPFEQNDGDGILYPGETIAVVQKYYFDPNLADNWAQSDKMSFDIEILAQQVDAPEPVKQLSFMNNKKVPGDWHVLADNKIGLLKYDSIAPTFNYNFLGIGLNPATEYCLIYYADPWSSHGSGVNGQTGFLIDQGVPNNNGDITLSGNKDFGTDLPNVDDENYPYGAKIWLLPCNQYNISSHRLKGWNPNNSDWLFDNWPGLIRYTKGETPITSGDLPQVETVYLNNLGATPQYGYDYDYGNANVAFTYSTPANGKLTGTINATGLKPYFTYQVKFIGKPTCDDPSGDDTTNEKIGYKGRWTVTNVSCSGSGCNRTDSQYEASKTNSECVAGYLVWAYFTTDENGNAAKTITTDSSYHVLYCSGGSCGATGNSQLTTGIDSNHSSLPLCNASDVSGQIERYSCGSLTLDPGNYDLKLVLTEESFHQSPGTWTTVMGSDINFEIE